jgi:hypothetical protein
VGTTLLLVASLDSEEPSRMACTSEATKRGLHRRWHVNKNILKADCQYCQLASQAAGNTLPFVPDPPTTVEKAKKRLEITSKLVEFDGARAASMASRNRKLQEAAAIFDMSPEQYEAEIQNAFGISWEQLSSRASIALFDEIESAIWREARGGDIRFISLLVTLGKLPGWAEAPIPEAPMRRLPSGVHEILPAEDYRTLSTAELEKKRLLLNKKALEAVIDRPSTAERLSSLQTPTLEITDTVEVPEGWIRMPNGATVAVGCEEPYELRRKVPFGT